MTAIAIVKPISVRRGHLAGLKAVLDYINDDAKTKNGELVFGWNCQKDRAFQDMLLIKNLFSKTMGRQYVHFVQSFHEWDNLTPELACRIGQEYIAGNDKWRDFQVLMAVHTNEDHMHIHYIINSVNTKDCSKWQCSKQYLKNMRAYSDELCRKYHLHVIERGNHGHRSYGEYANYQNGVSWKAMLAADIADCLQRAKSNADFLHRLDERGIDADFGTKNVMFSIRAGTYGLKKDMMCSNYKLMSYGDFSRENIINHFKMNKGLLELALGDFTLLQDAFLTIGKIRFPNNPTHLQDLYFSGTELASFDGLTREEIEAYLKRKKFEQLQKKAWAEWEKQSKNSGIILARITDMLALILQHRKEQQTFDYTIQDYENEENEHEI